MKVRAVFFSLATALCALTYAGTASAQAEAAKPSADLSDSAAVSPITFEELRFFVRDWRRYAGWLKNEGKNTGAVAYAGVSQNLDYAPESIRWLEERNWSPDRFFLIERRIRETLSVLKKEEKRRLVTEQMQRQISMLQKDKTKSPEEKAELKKRYLKNVENTVRSMKYEKPVTDKEMKMIEMNQKVLEKIMDM